MSLKRSKGYSPNLEAEKSNDDCEINDLRTKSIGEEYLLIKETLQLKVP